MTNRQRWYQIKARSARQDAAEVLIYGDIGESWFDESVTAAEFVRDLQKLDASHLDVRINSYGGSTPDGLAIFNALRRYPGTVHTHVDGIAASIASLIAMAGSRVFMAANAVLMIHAPWLSTVGNAKDLRDSADVLDQFARAMASCYDRTGEGIDRHLALLTDGEDHFFTAAEALAAGYIDEITEAQAVAARYLHNRFTAAQAARRIHQMPNEHDTLPGDELDTTAAGVPATRAQRRRARLEEAQAAEADDERRRYFDIILGRGDAAGLGGLAPGDDAKMLALRELAARAEVERWPMARIKDAVLAKLAEGVEPMRPTGAFTAVDPVSGQLGGRYIDTHEPRHDARAEGIIDAIVAKATRQPAKSELGRQLSRRPLVDIAAQALEWGGRRVRDLPPNEIIKASLIAHGTTDFPYHLQEAGNRIARAEYQAVPNPIKALARIIDAPDFREIQHLQLSEGPELLPVPEHAEYKHGSVLEAKETFRIGTYGRMFSISRHAMKNDDLGAFGTMARKLGRAAATFEGKFLADLLAENAGDGPVMADGKTLFHNDHHNVGTPQVLGITGIDELAVMMRRQKDIDGKTPINVTPTHLLVPASLEGLALTMTQALQPNDVESVNPYQGRFQVMVDPRLDDIATKAWYLVSTMVDGLLVAYLDGLREPHIETRVGWEIDGIEFKVRHDFGAGFVDYRGWAWNSGGGAE